MLRHRAFVRFPTGEAIPEILALVSRNAVAESVLVEPSPAVAGSNFQRRAGRRAMRPRWAAGMAIAGPVGVEVALAAAPAEARPPKLDFGIDDRAVRLVALAPVEALFDRPPSSAVAIGAVLVRPERDALAGSAEKERLPARRRSAKKDPSAHSRSPDVRSFFAFASKFAKTVRPSRMIAYGRKTSASFA